MVLDREIIGRGVYTPRQAARLIGSSPQHVLRWTRGSGPNEPLWHAHYQFIDDSTEISFNDLIELRVVEAMRRAGISLQSIRYAIEIAQDKFDIKKPLASKRFKTDGGEILMEAVEDDGEYVSLSRKRPGQKVFREIISQSLRDLEYEGDTVARWRPGGHEAVIIDPKRSFGDPLLDEFGISTSILLKEFTHFGDIRYLAKLYEIPNTAIQRAVSFEQSLEQAN
ncbi:hypothetical protein ROLI_034420 [Roseobacter fucihabitans]|uniref:DUF433 domain-containing protein n=1 Tax=Roseobacter fucihabitans TaxID=1537242 RepID=A0ABZ2BWC1_9RHOB|nr:hypothetical protein [Roseobacter litoralis]MBC6966833.1 hypothetical protein [Roseobacter litoralis]